WLRSGHPGDDAPPRILSEGFAEKLGDLCDALRLAAPESAEAGNAGLGWLAATAWAAYASASDVPAGTHLHPGVEAAAKWLSEHAHKPDANDLDGLARRVHLSRPHLSRLFAEQTGQSLSGFRRAKRVQRFLALVGRGGRRNLTEAAYAAGFASYSQCFRAVREVTGKSPRDCRASARRTSG
ncbi:MAG: AraC family transcriptional regulator, partial [Planctomycetota bacterium]